MQVAHFILRRLHDLPYYSVEFGQKDASFFAILVNFILKVVSVGQKEVVPCQFLMIDWFGICKPSINRVKPVQDHFTDRFAIFLSLLYQQLARLLSFTHSGVVVIGILRGSCGGALVLVAYQHILIVTMT